MTAQRRAIGRLATMTMATLAAWFGAVEVAAACSGTAPPECVAGGVWPNGATVPANLPHLEWHTTIEGASEADVTWARADAAGGGEVAFALEAAEHYTGYRIVPEAELEAGTRYRVEVPSVCSDDALSAELDVTAAAPVPTTLGEMTVVTTEQREVPIPADGECFTHVTAAVADVALVPSAEVEPWLDVLSFDTVVDGEPYDPLGTAVPNNGFGPDPWRGGATEDTIYAACDTPPEGSWSEGVGEGPHTVTMRAVHGRVFGTTLEADPVEIALECDADPMASGDADPMPSGSGGCNLAAAGSSPLEPGTALATALVAVWIGRRRRRRAHAFAAT